VRIKGAITCVTLEDGISHIEGTHGDRNEYHKRMPRMNACMLHMNALHHTYEHAMRHTRVCECVFHIQEHTILMLYYFFGILEDTILLHYQVFRIL